MHSFSVVFTVLTVFILSVLGAPLPSDLQLDKRSYSGQGTWFYDGLGACGQYNSNTDSIVALPSQLYGSGGSCNLWVQVTNTANWETAYGMVRDECPGCGEFDLDMSIGLFQQIGDLSTGVLGISWEVMPAGFSPP